jgi:glycogen debranching enzyme
LHEDGRLPALPLATIELQGYLYAARLAMAELNDHCGDMLEAERLQHSATQLRALVEARYWLEDEGFYAVALDGHKEPVRSATSNPGQLLWTGLPSPEHAARTARRMLEDDMFSGWGLRTLSARHVRYNALSYQRGSVWPHDTLLTAAGMHRYGFRHEAAVLIRAILDAANAFEDARLPELFCGIERGIGAPVPYAEANIPQAWAAATPILATQLFLGIVPDAPRGRCDVDPSLPEWLPTLEIDGLAVGNGTLRVAAIRDDTQTRIDHVSAHGVDVIAGTRESPLWGPVPRP